MKVICRDNYDREGPGYDDVLIAINLTEEQARELASTLNTRVDPDGSNFYMVAPDDYKLRKFEP